MKSATIADLRNHLSSYLKVVERGEKILVRRRGEVIAEIRPPPPATEREDADEDLDARLVELENQGLIRRGSGRLPGWCLQPLAGPRANLLKALLEEREAGR